MKKYFEEIFKGKIIELNKISMLEREVKYFIMEEEKTESKIAIVFAYDSIFLEEIDKSYPVEIVFRGRKVRTLASLKKAKEKKNERKNLG